MSDPERENPPRPGSWAFLTNYAHVLLCIARDPRARASDMAAQIGITERATQRILADLVGGGYVTRTKVGRRNLYAVDLHAHLPHPLRRDLSIGALLQVLNTEDRSHR